MLSAGRLWRDSPRAARDHERSTIAPRADLLGDAGRSPVVTASLSCGSATLSTVISNGPWRCVPSCGRRGPAGSRDSALARSPAPAGLSGRDLPAAQALTGHASILARAERYQASGAFPDHTLSTLQALAYLHLLNDVTAHDAIAFARTATAQPPGNATRDEHDDEDDEDDRDPGGETDRGTNTSENFWLSAELLRDLGLDPAIFLAITKPYAERRTIATARRRRPPQGRRRYLPGDRLRRLPDREHPGRANPVPPGRRGPPA